MNLYPAIDLYEGKVVRLKRGDFSQSTIYSDRPEDIAAKWQDEGADWIHVVDLEGAKSGAIQNWAALKKIRARVTCPIEIGGGIRSVETLNELLQAGFDRCIIGTKALDETFLGEVMGPFSKKIGVGLDVRDGKVQTQGWLQDGGVDVTTILKRLKQFTVKTIIYTDISKDGMLKGPNFEGLKQILALTSAKVILSGGVGALEDIRKAFEIQSNHFEGVIIGKALYEQKFSLKEARKLLKESEGNL